MNYKKINIISDVYFGLILLSGIAYTGLLIMTANKIMSAFLMQIIFLLDTIKNNNNLGHFLVSNLFLINTVGGILWLYLATKFFKGIGKIIKSLILTKKWLRGIEIENKKEDYWVVKNQKGLVVTAGFGKPIILISKDILKNNLAVEIEGMLEHEKNHQENYHPLKLLIGNFVGEIFWPIPAKRWLIDNYKLMLEIASDKRAEEKLNNKNPIVMALLKFEKNDNSLQASFFNSQSERIKILVGKKKWSGKMPMAYFSIILAVIISANLMMKNNNIFFECQHLWGCVQQLFDGDVSLISVDKKTEMLIPSDHCQSQVFDTKMN